MALVQVAVGNGLRTSTLVTESGSTVSIILEMQARCSVFTFQTLGLGQWFLQIIFRKIILFIISKGALRTLKRRFALQAAWNSSLCSYGGRS